LGSKERNVYKRLRRSAILARAWLSDHLFLSNIIELELHHFIALDPFPTTSFIHFNMFEILAEEVDTMAVRILAEEVDTMTVQGLLKLGK